MALKRLKDVFRTQNTMISLSSNTKKILTTIGSQNRKRKNRRKSNTTPNMEYSGHQLLRAAEKDNCEMLQTQLEHGVFADIADRNGYSPLTHAVPHNCMTCVKLLLRYGACVNYESDSGLTPLTMACESGLPEMCELLLRHGADLEYTNVEGYTPLHVAVSASRWTCVDVLLHHGANFRTTANNGATLIHALTYTPSQMSCPGNELELMSRLIQMGVDVDAKASYDDVYKGRYITALQLALIVPNMKAAVLLIQAGCDLNGLRFPESTFLEMDATYLKIRMNTRWREFIENKLQCAPSLASLSRNIIRSRVENCLNLTNENCGLPNKLVEFVQLVDVCTESVRITI